VFEALDLDTAHELAYRQLLTSGRCPVGEVEQLLGLRAADAASLVEDLRSRGLLTISDGCVVPVSLAAAAQLVTKATAVSPGENSPNSVQRLRYIIEGALHNQPDGRTDLRALRGKQAVEYELLAAALLARRENLSIAVDVLAACEAPVDAPSGTSLDTVLRRRTPPELGLRGVGYLQPAVQQAMLARAPSHATYRFSPTPPMRVEMFDRQVAFLPINPDNPGEGAYVTRSPGVCALLSRIFFDLWSAAAPLGGLQDSTTTEGRSDFQMRVLAGLAEGHTDERIARSLQVSRSTVTRAVREMEQALSAGSRFQLAVRATREGWLGRETLLWSEQP
jgi:DNA-binding CsgD family transcriptional regulator